MEKPSNGRPLLILVNPLMRIKAPGSNIGMNRLLGRKTGMTPCSLPLVAALTPDRFRVRIVDEELEPIPQETPDLVGITMTSPNSRRAYEIADAFRARKVPVIAGGPYVSYNVEEALGHVDAVVRGEAEGVWAECLADFERGALKSVYQAKDRCEFKRSPVPRWDLLDTKSMAALPVQASRGCPFHCDFCLVPELFGGRMRYRDIDDLMREIESLPLKTLFFVDDNLTADKQYARELMKRLKPLGLNWFCMASLELARFPDLLRDMAEAGCMHVLVGLESVNPASITETHKVQNNVEKYTAAVEAFHRAGIEVNASFVVGFDNDTLEDYGRIHRFMGDAGLWYANLNILDAIPGTRLHARVVREGRWYGRTADLSGGMFPVMHYNRVSQTELLDRHFDAHEEIYSYEDLGRRAVKLFETGCFATERPNRDMSAFAKVVISVKLVFMYLFSADRHKRSLFLSMFRLMREKKAAPGRVVFFLLTVEGMRRQMALLRGRLPEWRRTIAAVDKGPWEKMNGPANEAADPAAS